LRGASPTSPSTSGLGPERSDTRPLATIRNTGHVGK
jgi:hypothetical protein